MRNSLVKAIALGGVFAALAMVIMSLGAMIPGMTYICPLLCLVMTLFVYRLCGQRIAWTWYAAVAILAALLSPDKEAAGVFVALGYYPILKPKIERRKLRWLWKGLLFNGAVILLYGLLIGLMGLPVEGDTQTERAVMLGVLLLLGNVTFFAADFLLSLLANRFFREK